MQQLSLSTPTGQRPARIALGIAGIVALALVLGWFLLQLEPAAPRRAAAPETPSAIGSLHDVTFFDDNYEVVPVATGEALKMKGFVHGRSFAYSDEEWAELTSQLSRQRVLEITEAPDWRFKLGDIDILPETARIVSEEAFEEWHSGYDDATVYNPAYAPEDMRIVLVDVSVANHSDGTADARYLYLTSAKFKEAAEGGPAIAYPDDAALRAIYGVPDDKAPFKTLPEGWDTVEPGESRTLTLPFVIYHNELDGQDAIDHLSVADFQLLTYRCDPLTVYTMPLR